MTPFHLQDDQIYFVSPVSRDGGRDEIPEKPSKSGPLTRDETQDKTLFRLVVSPLPPLGGERDEGPRRIDEESFT
jgi:hypothetical protein